MPLLLIAFIVVPIVELYVIIQVGQSIGVLWTIALLIADSILGGMLMRSQGRAAWQRFAEALAAGRVPGREVVDGGLVIFGGALLLTPGFASDILGLLLLAPPTRAAIRKIVLRRFGVRLASAVQAQQAAGPGAAGPFRGPFGPPPRTGRQDFDVEGTAREHEPPRLRHDAP